MRSLRILDVMNAAVDALKADATLATLLGGAKVYTNVPEDTPAPYVKLASGGERPWAEANNDDDSAMCILRPEIHSAATGTLEVDTIANRLTQVLTTESTYAGVTGYVGRRFEEYLVFQNEQMVQGKVYRQG